jgi:polysaccharide deacetylase family protein (PEP-CTERM system associated)
MTESLHSGSWPIRNVLTFDVEDWFHGFRFSPTTQQMLPHRLDAGLARVLEILETHRVKATFFVLGSLVEEWRSTLGLIVDAGHEIAAHGYQHAPMYHLSPASFAGDLRRTLVALRSVVGCPIRSYRAPFFSITRRNLWALPILVKAGITRDSSIVPAHNPRYGIPSAQRFPHPVFTDYPPKLTEYPISTLSFGGVCLPFGGGFYARLLPYRLIQAAVRQLNAQGRPAVFYFHPWEFDPDHPRVSEGLPALYRFTHYYRLGCTATKLQALLRDFPFGPLSAQTERAAAPSQMILRTAYAGQR